MSWALDQQHARTGLRVLVAGLLVLAWAAVVFYALWHVFGPR